MPLANLPESSMPNKPKNKKPLKPLYNGVKKGTRNDSLAKLAGSWARNGLNFDECFNEATRWNEKNEHPLSEDEIQRTVDSIYRTHHSTCHGTPPTVYSKFYPRPFTEPLLDKCKFLWEGDKRYLWIYNRTKGIWTPNGEDFIKNYFRTTIDAIDDTMKKRNIIDEIIEDVKGVTYNADGLPETNINLIPFANGVYDLEANKFRKFQPEDFFTSKLPWKFNSKAKCKFLKTLINSSVPKKTASSIWDLIAYLLWRGYPNQIFFFLVGQGHNGKSTVTTIITRLLGTENISAISLGEIQKDSFAGASLHKKLANISGELEYSDLKKTDFIKKVTGGDLIEANVKYKARIQFYNFAKLIFLTNQIPVSRDTTDAFFRRNFIIEFPYQFEIDPILDVRIREDSPEMTEELEGLLYIALQRLKKLIKRRFKFIGQKDIKSIREHYMRLSNPILRFIDETCNRTRNHEDYITKSTFTEHLNEWLLEQGSNTYNTMRIGRELKEFGYEDSKKKGPTDGRYNAWIGIKWKDTVRNDLSG